MGKLLLLGSGEFTSSMEIIDKSILNELKLRTVLPKVAILPTAAGLEDTVDYWINLGEKHFNKLGGKGAGVRILNYEDANDESKLDEVSDCDWVYFSGGNPAHLLNTLKQSKLLDLILEKFKMGMPWAGCSAGAMVMGKYVLTNPNALEKGGERLVFANGLNLIPYTIIPHFNYMIEHDLIIKLWNGTDPAVIDSFMGIDEDTALIVEDNRTRIEGRGFVRHLTLQKSTMYRNQSLPSFI